MAITRATFPLPDVEDPITAPFFAGAARGELTIPHCGSCDRFVWYPEPTCPACGGAPVWTAVSGRGTLFSWAVVRRPFLPAFAEMVPFVTGLVALAEDPTVRVPTLVVPADAALTPALFPLLRTLSPAESCRITWHPDRAPIEWRAASVASAAGTGTAAAEAAGPCALRLALEGPAPAADTLARASASASCALRRAISLCSGVSEGPDRKSTRLNSSHVALSRMPSSA